MKAVEWVGYHQFIESRICDKGGFEPEVKQKCRTVKVMTLKKFNWHM